MLTRIKLVRKKEKTNCQIPGIPPCMFGFCVTHSYGRKPCPVSMYWLSTMEPTQTKAGLSMKLLEPWTKPYLKLDT